MTWDEWVERDKPILDGKYTYFEWTWEEVLDVMMDEESDYSFARCNYDCKR
jgi:hypothetical protein